MKDWSKMIAREYHGDREKSSSDQMTLCFGLLSTNPINFIVHETKRGTVVK